MMYKYYSNNTNPIYTITFFQQQPTAQDNDSLVTTINDNEPRFTVTHINAFAMTRHGEEKNFATTTKVIYDNIMHQHSKNSIMQQNQISSADDIWLTDLDKPVWVKSFNKEAVARNALRGGIDAQTQQQVDKIIDSLVHCFYQVLTNAQAPPNEKITFLQNELTNTQQQMNNLIFTIDSTTGTRKTIYDLVNTIARQHFQRNCFPVQDWCSFQQSNMIMSNMSQYILQQLLTEVKEIIIPVLCSISSNQQYDVFLVAITIILNLKSSNNINMETINSSMNH